MNEKELQALLSKYGNLNFVKRMLMKNPPKLGNSTHSFSWGEADGKYYVFPTVIQDPKDGKLKRLTDDQAWEYANKTGELIPFDDPKQAESFSKHEEDIYKPYFEGKTANNMTSEEWKKKKEQIDADLASGKITPQQAMDQYAASAKDNPVGFGDDFQRFMARNPSLAAPWMAKRQEELARGELSGKLAAGLETLTNLGFTAASINQIVMANQAQSQLQRPSLPGIPGRDPALQQAMYEARQGVMNPNAILDPAKQEIQNSYLGAQAANQLASGGQAGALQGMNQVANLQRMQANLGLAPIAQEVKMQNQQNYNSLLGQRLNETQNQFQNQTSNYGNAWDRYAFGAQAAGALGQSGRTNLADSAQRLAQSIAQGAAYAPSWIKSPGLGEADNSRIQNIYAEAALNSQPKRPWSIGPFGPQINENYQYPQPQPPALKRNPWGGYETNY